MKYLVEFERVGRNHNVENLSFEGTEDQLIDAVLRHCRRHLASRGFDVSIDLSTGRGWIEAGRFGKFLVKESDGAA